MNGVDLEKALHRLKHSEERSQPDAWLEAYRELLKKDDLADEAILQRIFSGSSAASRFHLRNLDPDRIFTVDQIKELCTRFRLRFLEAALFKGEIPHAAVAEIKRLEKLESNSLDGYMIMAPAPLFHLEYKDKDPLLFASLGNGRYYLIHKWGKDLHPLRALAVWPFRSFKSLLTTIALLAFTIVMSVPSSVMMGPYDSSSLGIRAIFFIYLFIAMSGLTILYGFSRMKDFNGNLWNSKYKD